MAKTKWEHKFPSSKNFICERCTDATSLEFDASPTNAVFVSVRRGTNGDMVDLFLCSKCLTELGLFLLDLADSNPNA